MKNSPQYARKFASLYRQVKSAHSAEPPDAADPITQLVIGFLEWNTSRRAARKAHDALLQHVVDNNDLRVSRPEFLIGVIGRDYDQVEERIERLLESMREVFLREQATSLDALHKKSKKDVRHYLDTLPGMTPYVAAQVTLMCFEGHAIPVDDRLIEALRTAEAVDPEATPEEIESFLERHIKAEHALEAHANLMAWVDAGGRRSAPRRAAATVASRKPTRKPAASKASKKK